LQDQVNKIATNSAILGVTAPTISNNPVVNFMNPLFNGISEIWGNIFFKGKVNFENSLTFNNQTAGLAVINSDNDRVEVKFDNALDNIPVVNLTMVSDNNDSDILNQNYSYLVTNRSISGFTIVLNKKATNEVKFSWIALVIKDMKTYQNQIVPTATPALEPTVTPTVVPANNEEISTPSGELITNIE
jgi:hypothetical protein